ncbi:acyltransferase [Duganella violaceipulchra]|uniref:Acetyltransferase-like isoleucine patch superfamily enzyme n=2 Tax=Duganella violaceipulchra TaxID=2849652 RepID=A0ABT1GL44_9BURK|nr:DapH/DapD/GlmU-related protein [Duganella violaceicalia]MCP2009403.1 acetyltransferase-like isoleucine patch superfamily enzyme [Duganella violaceicalia]
MRKIRLTSIVTFLSMLALVLLLAVLSAYCGVGAIPSLGDFRGVAVSAAAVLLVYLYGLLIFRLFLWAQPLHDGNIEFGSRQEFIYQVYVLFYLILFNSLIRGGMIPIPIMRLIYLALGARLGANTYSSGIIYDPSFVTIGANSVIGETALLVPHVIEGDTLGHYFITIGDHVTIGAHAVVLSGVTIGDNAIVAANSLVAKGTRIGSGEVWGGSPARRLK